jgi:hypothetical protein
LAKYETRTRTANTSASILDLKLVLRLEVGRAQEGERLLEPKGHLPLDNAFLHLEIALEDALLEKLRFGEDRLASTVELATRDLL